MARVCVLLAACLLSLLLLLSTAQQQQQEYSLEAFSNVTSCLPFNVLISPSSQDGGTSSSSGSHSLRVDAAPGAAAALRAAAVNGTLFLGFNRSFESTTPLKVTISLPAAGLVAVDNRGQGNVIINPGFSASSSPSGRVVALTTSAGNILARGLSTPQLVIKAGGTSDVFVRGDIQAATVNADGTSTVTVSGVTQSLSATLGGISKAYVDAASDAVTISSKAEGLSKVFYNKGKCETGKGQGSRFSLGGNDDEGEDPFFSMALDFGFGSCVKVNNPNDFPSYQALWSCGLRVRGASMCVPGDAAAQEAAAKAASIRVVSATAPNSQATAAASSESGPIPTPATTQGPNAATPTTPTTTASSTPPPTVTSTTPSSTPPASGTGGGSTNAASSGPSTPPSNNAAPTGPAGNSNSGPTQQQAGRRVPELAASAADIKVAAAGRRRLQAEQNSGVFASVFGGGPLNGVFSSSSSSSSSRGGRHEAVAVASLDCDAPVAELYIAAA